MVNLQTLNNNLMMKQKNRKKTKHLKFQMLLIILFNNKCMNLKKGIKIKHFRTFKI